MIRADEMPYRTGLVYRDGTPVSYDPADYVGSFDRLLADFDYEGWRRRQRETAGSARPIGVGLAAYVQGTGVGPVRERGRPHRRDRRRCTSTSASPRRASRTRRRWPRSRRPSSAWTRSASS